MSTFENVTVTKAANIYFDGNVTSRALSFADGSIKTLGIMMPGEYRFSTSQKEIMDIQAGRVEVRLPDSASWLTVAAGETFTVPANAAFDIKVLEVTDYCCSYIEEV
jgi:uncharacterized protein YaiE (UPF0345 family)